MLQAEELNSIVGNAFRMAYASQLQEERQDGVSVGVALNTKILGTPPSDLHHNWVSRLLFVTYSAISLLFLNLFQGVLNYATLSLLSFSNPNVSINLTGVLSAIVTLALKNCYPCFNQLLFSP